MFSFNIVRNLKEGFSKQKQWLPNFATDWNNLGTLLISGFYYQTSNLISMGVAWALQFF